MALRSCRVTSLARRGSDALRGKLGFAVKIPPLGPLHVPAVHKYRPRGEIAYAPESRNHRSKKLDFSSFGISYYIVLGGLAEQGNLFN